ncbi:MAG: histidine kinase [Nonlabens sp.]
MRQTFILLLLLGGLLTAQEPVSIHLTEKDGLPDKEFYGLVEDSKGFIWLAGNKGLTRFDGKNFKTYSHPDKRGLSVFEINIDSKNRVWCINISGQVFYLENDQMILFRDFKEELKGHLPQLVVLGETLVMRTTRKIFIVDIPTKKMETINYNLYEININPFLFNNQIIISEEDYIKFPKFEQRTVFRALPSFFKELNGQGLIPRSIEIEKNHILTCYTSAQSSPRFFKFSDNTALKIDSEAVEHVRNIQKIKYIDDKIWICTSKGIYALTIHNGAIEIVDSFFKNNFTTDILRDRDGNYFVTTLNDGIYVIPNLYINKLNLSQEISKTTALAHLGDSILYVGSNGGTTVKYNVRSQTAEYLDFSDNQSVSDIAIDSFRNQVSIVKKLKTITLNHKGKIVRPVTNHSSTKKLVYINADSIMLAAAGKSSIAPIYHEFKRDSTTYSILKRGYTCLYDANTKSSYFGLVDELVKVDQHLNIKKLKRQNNEDVLTKSMTMDKKGSLWVATFTHGLLKFENDTFADYWNTSNGLLSDNLNAITLNKPYLWISGDAGIQRLHTETGEIKSLTKEDGVPYYSVVDIQPVGNRIYFSGGDYVFMVEEDKAFKNFTPLDFYFTEVSINGRQVPVTDSYDLQEKESELKVSFNGTGLRAMSSGNYEYRLKGLSQDWIQINPGVHSVFFNSIPSGTYQFQLRPSERGSKTASLKEIDIIVSVPFYETFWFWGLVVLLVVFVVLYVQYRRSRFRESEKNKQLSTLKREKEFINLKLENLRSQMNPHFVFNALNSIQEYILKNQRSQAGDYLGKFADLIRTYLDHSVKGRISLQEEIDSLHMYLELEQLRFEERLSYKIQVDLETEADRICIPTMLIQPYVENALKHGLLHLEGERRLSIVFSDHKTAEEAIICTIEDNGIGRKRAKELQAKKIKHHKSFATKATGDRISLLNYVLEKEASVSITDKYDGDNATGTLVCIKIPYTIET